MNQLLHHLRHNPMASLGLALLIVIVFGVSLPGLWSGWDPDRMEVASQFAAPGNAHWLGTDQFGRDVLSRLLHGGQYTLLIGCGVVALAFTTGVALGTVAGFYGGWVDGLIMRLVDALLSFPGLVLAIALAATFGPGLVNAMFAVALSMAPAFARVARGQALSITARPYVEAAICIGVPTRTLLLRYVLRNGIGPLLVQASLGVGSAILQTASLGYLGLGAQPPQSEWGADLAANLQFIDRSPWIALAPGLAILLTALSFNLLGDALSEWFNPKTRSSR